MIDVTCAIIRNDEGLVLAVRRGPGMGNAGKWEFPGGKTRAGEDHEECIANKGDRGGVQPPRRAGPGHPRGDASAVIRTGWPGA